MLGLASGTVRLEPHDTEWEREAARTTVRLRGLLGDVVRDIAHVGSTAIPAICAKPIVDIALAVDDFSDVLAREELLRENGFYYRPNASIPRQLLFACGSHYDGTGNLQTHFIHVVRAGGTEWRNYLAFRDYLNTHADAAREYERLKLVLAAAAPVDKGRAQYLAGKQAFIADIMRRAKTARTRTGC